MSGGGGQTSTTTATIPDELKPLAATYTAKATDLANQAYTPYTDQRYADLNSYQTQGADAIANRATNGSADVNAGSANLQATLNGDYLNSNPYMDQNYDAAAKAVTKNYQGAVNGTDATFARNGAFGGSAWNQAQQNNSDSLAKGLGDMSASMYGQNYANERQNQMTAQNTALNYGNQDYTDANQMIKAGQMYQDQAQQGLDFNYQQFGDAQNDPYKKLAAMSGVFGTNLGQGSTTQSSGGGK